MPSSTTALPTLLANDRSIDTPFGLLGTNENALTFALGYTFQQCPGLLQWFLKQIGLPGVHRSALANAEIALQRHRKGESAEGITDIEIRLPGRFHIIVEAKVGTSVPTIKQCQKYVPRLKQTNEPEQIIVALVETWDESFSNKYASNDAALNQRLHCFQWTTFIPKCVRLITGGKISGMPLQAVRWFYEFLDQEYRMKAFTTEVWIVPASDKPNLGNGQSYLGIHRKHRMYFDSRQRTIRPLYIGFRAQGMLESLHRVLQIEHETPVSKYVLGLTTEWMNNPLTIWHLDDPFLLPTPLPTGANMATRRTHCDLDLLFRCKTEREVELAMKDRRQQA